MGSGEEGKSVINNPMMVEVQGEAFLYPSSFAGDGSELREAERVVRAMSKTQFEAILGSSDNWQGSKKVDK